MCIHFLCSVTISNGSAFYFFEIIVLISLEGIPTQIGMGVGSITFHARGSMRGQYVFFMPKSQTFNMPSVLCQNPEFCACLVDICRERADLLAFRLCCFTLSRLDVLYSFRVWCLGKEVEFDCIRS